MFRKDLQSKDVSILYHFIHNVEKEMQCILLLSWELLNFFLPIMLFSGEIIVLHQTKGFEKFVQQQQKL